MSNSATPLAVIVLLQGMKIAAFMQSWLVIVSMESYPLDFGNLVIKSIAITLNSSALGLVVMGYRCGFWQ